MITVYKKGTSEIRAVIDPDDKSQQQCGIMRNDIVTLTFAVADPVFFEIGDYTTIFGAYYQVNLPPVYKAVADRNIEYTVTLEGLMYDLKKAAYLFLDASNHFTEGKFPLRGRPLDFMKLIVYNMERWSPGSGWILGSVIEGDYQVLTFDSQNCLKALSTIATTFKTEYLIEGRKISLFKKQLGSAVTLEYGRGQALSGIGTAQQDTGGAEPLITRLYAYGSNRNIGSEYRHGAKYLRMADSLFVEKNADSLGVFEAYVYFDDIYPRREGTVSAVGTNLQFTDAAIDFNVNDYLLAGVTAQVTFNTGLLTGYTFDIHNFDNVAKQFTINVFTNETVNLPTDLLKPAVGDKYVLINIDMPLSYVTNAEAELKLRAITEINTNGPAKISFPVDCNSLWFKRTSTELALGFTYQLLSTRLAINRQIRLVNYTRNLRKPEVYTSVEFADLVAVQPNIIKIINLI